MGHSKSFNDVRGCLRASRNAHAATNARKHTISHEVIFGTPPWDKEGTPTDMWRLVQAAGYTRDNIAVVRGA